jgi:hypothetical protein
MSKVREKDSGKYQKHTTGLPVQPTIDKLDLTKPKVKDTANNFKRPVLSEKDGRARPKIPSTTQGPTVQSQP